MSKVSSSSTLVAPSMPTLAAAAAPRSLPLDIPSSLSGQGARLPIHPGLLKPALLPGSTLSTRQLRYPHPSSRLAQEQTYDSSDEDKHDPESSASRLKCLPENDYAGVYGTEIRKNGWLYKRGRRRNWARRWFVLRDHQLAYYKDEREYKPQEIISAADIMSAAMVSDHHKPNHFAVFTSSSNMHLRADNGPDAQDWVDVLRHTADDAAESTLSSSFKRLGVLAEADRADPSPLDDHLDAERPRALLPGATITDSGPHSLDGMPAHRGLPHHKGPDSPRMGSPGSPAYVDFSGTDALSSNASDAGVPHLMLASKPHQQEPQEHSDASHSQVHSDDGHQQPAEQSSASSPEKQNQPLDHTEHLIQSGYLLRLKKRYNQWRRQWVVLTNERIAFYKSEDTKAPPVKIIELSHIADVVDIDPLSKSKIYCMQIITPEKRIRFCAYSEEELATWLAALKSLLKEKHTWAVQP